jgi:hypothetical protein
MFMILHFVRTIPMRTIPSRGEQNLAVFGQEETPREVEDLERRTLFHIEKNVISCLPY